MRKLLLLGALAAIFVAASSGTAAAETFDGSCHFTGVGTFDPPYTYVVTNRNYIATGKGTCTGKLDGKAYKGPTLIRLDGRMRAPMSCGIGATPGAIVPGTLTFGKDARRVNAKRVGLALANVHSLFLDHFFVQGAYNGIAVGEWVFQVGVQTLSDCRPDRAGLKKLNFTMDLQTVRPLYG